VRATLKGLHSPDIEDLERWVPNGEPFGFLLQAMIGPSDGSGAESFTLQKPGDSALNSPRQTKPQKNFVMAGPRPGHPGEVP
jgi:hypothetical protein